MKLRRVLVENVRSFLEPQQLVIPGDVAILIGPNGGGKTNLLDTATVALRLYFLKSWVAQHQPSGEWQDRYNWVQNDIINASLLEKHSSAPNSPQRIELDIEITSRDIENILRAKSEAKNLEELSKRRYTSYPASTAAAWDTDHLRPGEVFTYRILDRNRVESTTPNEKTFLNYLEAFEIDSHIRAEHQRSNLSTPMLSLPVNRSSGGVPVSVSLASFNEFDSKRSVDGANSRTVGSIISLAIGRLAGRYRDLLEFDNGKARQVFDADPGIKAFTATLRSLGYDWTLECTNARRNLYDIRLSKQGSSFLVSAASSGERELLTYLFAVYALNVSDALIVIDEPELHLHPRWQKTLLALFERLSADTGNQFVMATHSPVFVSPASIQYVSRISSEQQQSRITRLGDSKLPQAKHLFNIVNSQNNERLFFADRVVLVEGISDRIFFEAVLEHFRTTNPGLIVEIIDVGGKGFFEPYQTLLDACRIPYKVIADLDFVAQVGTDSLKALFTVKSKDVHEKVASDPQSIDGLNLVSRLDEAIRTGNTADLILLWEYIKARLRRLRSNLTQEEQRQLKEFITATRAEGLFILSEGELEAYLPIGSRGKDLEKVIRLVTAPDFWSQLPQPVKGELSEIAVQILAPTVPIQNTV